MFATAPATVQRSVHYPVSREQVFRAWTTPEALKVWWRPGPYISSEVVIDLRPGGQYRISMIHPDGSHASISGTYLEVVAPERLVVTWVSEGGPRDDGTESLLTLEFFERGGSTELRLTHERLSIGTRDGFDAGWTGVLGKLAAHLLQPQGQSDRRIEPGRQRCGSIFSKTTSRRSRGWGSRIQRSSNRASPISTTLLECSTISSRGPRTWRAKG